MPDTEEDPTAELTTSFSLAARALFQAGSFADTLQLVVDLAVECIDGCECAGIYLHDEDAADPAVSSDLAAALGAAQRRFNEGPCLDAVVEGGFSYAGELIDDTRWPRFGPEAAEKNVRSVLALHLLGNGTLGALGLYSHFPLAFGIADRAKAQIFATIAGLALAAAHLHDDDGRRFEELHQALATRELIGQAQGILMERERITTDQAFDILRVASQHLNVKLRDVAKDLVETGTTPGASRDRSRP